MSKFKIVLISIFTIALIILTSAVVYQNIKYDKLAKEEEKVTDECIYENNEIENDIDEIKVSETETKVSPNAELVIKKYYKECGHTTEEKRNVANDMVNKTQEEIEKLYPDYKVESFFNNKIVLIKEEEGQCDEHYIVRDENSNIMIYKILSDGKEEIYQNTGISTEYLPETDKISLRDGIKVFGRENLNSIIEDFE
ncbi:MAG: hypothetical protein BHV96_06080 [Clostridium sp. CAG:354_28_25]|jgi:copper chaperone CopZ|uniref:BofC C-terminal domain-containing protein n=1 Tax=Candidatus Merdicola sp. TaxID=3085652 RepID=UPI00095BAA6D|nr:MAG: hypothetical protein BHV96_06080 [Clostridium sp. CAG:354_28_25]